MNDMKLFLIEKMKGVLIQMRSKRVIAGLLASALLMSNSMNVFDNSVGV